MPLHQGNRDATIDLQRLLHEQFDAARYDNYIYRGQPQPPLAEADAAWARGLTAVASDKQ